MARTVQLNPLLRRILLAVALIVILVLTVLASVAVHTAERLSIPIPANLKAATLASPILQLLAVLSTLPLAKKFRPLSYLLPLLTVLTFVIDVGLVAAGSTRLDEILLDCALSSRWRQWYMAKDAGRVRQIQDALSCCGLQSSRDMAWPFPDRSHDAHACETAYGRHQDCISPWQGQARRVLAEIVGVGTAGVFFKIILLLLAWRLGFFILSSQASNASAGFGRASSSAADRARGSRDLLTGRIEEAQGDEGESDGDGDGHGRGGAVVATNRYTDD